MNITQLIAAGGNANYNTEGKAHFRRVSTKFLRDVAGLLGLAKGTFQVRFNSGGIAVSGDAILHADTFYVCITGTGAYWRHCDGQKDYTGKQNRQFGSEWTAEQFAAAVKISFDKR